MEKADEGKKQITLRYNINSILSDSVKSSLGGSCWYVWFLFSYELLMHCDYNGDGNMLQARTITNLPLVFLVISYDIQWKLPETEYVIA